MSRLFAIPDIHGRADLLLLLLDKLNKEENLDLTTDKLIFLGDMIDRGPSMDVGTAFELGYAKALGKKIYGYTNDFRNYSEAVLETKTIDGFDIEQFDLFDNLMVAKTVEDNLYPTFLEALNILTQEEKL